MQRPVAFLPLVVLSLVSGPALAQEDEAHEPGLYENPPSLEGEVEPSGIDPSPSQRAAVRGKPVESFTEDEKQKLLRLFEESSFPRPAESPEWVRDLEEGIRPERGPALRPGEMPPELVAPSRRPGSATGTVRPEDARPDLPWLRGLKTGDIPVRWAPQVIRYLQFYRDDPRGRAIMESWLRRQTRYKDLILEALRRNGLPEDLLYIVMIESSYDPGTTSRVGAAGLWQLMPANAEVYGLRLDRWVDDRRDPVKSTEAAMLYWKDVFERFRDWHLAMAAYNAGYGAVLQSIAKYNTNDFWTLVEYENGLPWGTSLYVPKMLACAIVGRNKEAFGFTGIDAAPPFEYDLVTVPKSVALSVIARAAGTDTETIMRLNPQLRRGRTPPGEDYTVRIPAGAEAEFARKFPQLRADWDNVEAYLVRHGERFEDIATTFGVSVRQLLDMNGARHQSEIRGGMTIVVPKVDADTRKKNALRAEESLYTSGVMGGEPGEPLIVPVPDKSIEVPGRRRVFYRVVVGDETLAEVATALGVSAADLARWNGLEPGAAIHARMVLQAWVAPDFEAEKANVKLLDDSRILVVTSGSQEHLDLAEGRKGRKRVKYVARKGDTLDSIGKRYHLTRYDLARINRRSYNEPVAPGEEILVYEIVDREKAQKAGVYKPPPKKRGKRRGRRR